jgi:hypothetical protein
MVKIFTIESFSTTSKKIAQDFNINLNFRNKIYAPNFSKHWHKKDQHQGDVIVNKVLLLVDE